MSLPFSGPVTGNGTCCERIPGTYPPDLAPYVRSINSLQGIVLIVGDEYIDVGSTGNTITIGLDVDSIIQLLVEEDGDFIALEGGISPGTGTVQSVELSSDTLDIGGTNPILTDGTITVNLTGATASIQALTTAANKMIYTTALDTYAVTDLTVFARTILDDASAVAVRATLGLVIGTNVQAWSADLDSFVTNASWSGSNLTLSGGITVTTITGVGAVSITGDSVFDGDLAVSGQLTGDTIVGNGAAINGINAGNISTGTLAVARGGTGLASYAVGDLVYASGPTTLTKLADVAVGSYLRSGGVTTAPLWSTLVLPNAATTGDILFASSANTIGNLAGVATGNALISGGVGAAPTWGKITTAHATGLAGSGNNTNITAFTGTNISFNDGATFNADTTFGFALVDAASSPGTSGQVLTSTGAEVQWSSSVAIDTFTAAATFQDDIALDAALIDASAAPGTAGQLLTSTGTAVSWSSDIAVADLTINTSLSTEGTITGAGTTGNQTINKLSGTCRFAAAASTLTVTNSLCSSVSRVLATASTNDGTAYVKNVVTASGSFTITLGAAATAETEVAWILFDIS